MVGLKLISSTYTTATKHTQRFSNTKLILIPTVCCLVTCLVRQCMKPLVHHSISETCLRNDLYCVKWDVKLYYTIPYYFRNSKVQFSDVVEEYLRVIICADDVARQL